MYEDCHRIILFGAGEIGRQALDFYGADRVVYFCDNNPALLGKEIAGKKVINFPALEKIWKDYHVVLAVGAKAGISIVPQLRRCGIEFSFFRDEQTDTTTGYKETFSHIYAKNLWGGRQWYSGSGSHDETIIHPYIRLLIDLIKNNDISSIVDIGCGDFNIMQQVLADCSEVTSYVGIDVVDGLVARNQRKFGSDSIRFVSLDASDETIKLPKAELCIIRQVLQHLDNAAIRRVVAKLQAYRYVLVTEHIYEGEGVIYNLDKPANGDIRLSRLSGVYLDQPPYNIPMVHLLKCRQNGGVIRTSIFMNADLGQFGNRKHTLKD